MLYVQVTEVITVKTRPVIEAACIEVWVTWEVRMSASEWMCTPRTKKIHHLLKLLVSLSFLMNRKQKYFVTAE